MMTRLIVLMVLAVSLVVVASPTPQPSLARQSDGVALAFHACPQELLDAPNFPDDRQVDCATLTVPENRSNPDTNLIELAVFIVRARFQDPRPDPLVYLTGGPGGTTSNIVGYFDYAFGWLGMDRDVILMDQRGTGRSEPSLACPAYGVANFEAYVGGYSLEEGAQHAADALLACHADFVAQGIDMNAYTSAENAADFEDLRLALGIEQWNLYGISYGTRLALTIMRDFPDGVRSAVIDSVVPVDGDLYLDTPTNGASALDRFFDLCASDAECSSTYPDLEDKFYTVVDRLNTEPLEVEVRRPSDGKYYPAVLNGDTLVGVMFFNMYSTNAIRSLPYMIQQAYDGFIGLLRQDFLPAYFAWDGIATGMHYSVNCNEEIIFNTFDEIAAASDALDPRLQFFYDVDNYITWDICEGWGVATPNPIEDQPVVSEVPTLILVGELDPITPPVWGQLAAQTLPNSTYVEIPNAGHGVTFAFDCPKDLMRWFLDDPTVPLETSCLREIQAPTFVLD